jgi:hypothetical protein
VAARVWTCRKCGHRNARKFTLCQTGIPVFYPGTSQIKRYERCDGRKPKPRKKPHEAERDATTYESLVERYGEQCGICGAGPKTRRLHRDHDHSTGRVRGLLCFRCNAVLRGYMTADWLRSAAAYLDRGVSDGYSPSLPVPEQEAT